MLKVRLQHCQPLTYVLTLRIRDEVRSTVHKQEGGRDLLKKERQQHLRIKRSEKRSSQNEGVAFVLPEYQSLCHNNHCNNACMS